MYFLTSSRLGISFSKSFVPFWAFLPYPLILRYSYLRETPTHPLKAVFYSFDCRWHSNSSLRFRSTATPTTVFILYSGGNFSYLWVSLGLYRSLPLSLTSPCQIYNAHLISYAWNIKWIFKSNWVRSPLHFSVRTCRIMRIYIFEYFYNRLLFEANNQNARNITL